AETPTRERTCFAVPSSPPTRGSATRATRRGKDDGGSSRIFFTISREVLEAIQEVVESDESVVILCWRLIREGERLMWKPEHRIAADRSGLRYPSDLPGAEWALVV